MLRGNNISKTQNIGYGPRAATLAAIISFLSAPLLFAQTDPQPLPETKPEKNIDSKSEKKVAGPKKQKAEDPERKFAAQCGIDFDQAIRRTLINSVSKGWREYTDTTRPPELADEDELFTVRADSGKHYVRAVHLGDDFDIYQDDCFGESGKLKFFHYEFRTAWGWGYEEARTYDPAGKLLEKTARFLDTQNEKTIEEPEHKAVADAMKPAVHKTYRAMPFTNFFDE